MSAAPAPRPFSRERPCASRLLPRVSLTRDADRLRLRELCPREALRDRLRELLLENKERVHFNKIFIEFIKVKPTRLLETMEIVKIMETL